MGLRGWARTGQASLRRIAGSSSFAETSQSPVRRDKNLPWHSPEVHLAARPLFVWPGPRSAPSVFDQPPPARSCEESEGRRVRWIGCPCEPRGSAGAAALRGRTAPRARGLPASQRRPSQLFGLGREIKAAEIERSRGGEAYLSARACESPELRSFLLGIQPGHILPGTVDGDS